MAEARAVLKLYGEKGIPIAVNYSRRYVPEVSILARRIESGEFGRFERHAIDVVRDFAMVSTIGVSSAWMLAALAAGGAGVAHQRTLLSAESVREPLSRLLLAMTGLVAGALLALVGAIRRRGTSTPACARRRPRPARAHNQAANPRHSSTARR